MVNSSKAIFILHETNNLKKMFVTNASEERRYLWQHFLEISLSNCIVSKNLFDFRPISIASCIKSVVEKVLAKHLMDYIEKIGYLHDF